MLWASGQALPNTEQHGKADSMAGNYSASSTVQTLLNDAHLRDVQAARQAQRLASASYNGGGSMYVAAQARRVEHMEEAANSRLAGHTHTTDSVVTRTRRALGSLLVSTGQWVRGNISSAKSGSGA
jgi:hypothetical protein